jgi:hypothetical protein
MRRNISTSRSKLKIAASTFDVSADFLIGPAL